VEAAGGVVLLGFTALALLLANSAWSEAFLGFWKTPLTLGIGFFEMRHSLHHWINDGLMGIFFFVVGLEVKRELVLGELRDPQRAALPVAAALGGMLIPAGVYLALQWGEPTARGWGIPMATDIAFVVGCMAILGPRIPNGLRVMLLSLAIVDDIGAILVIAIGYTRELYWDWLGLALAALVLVIVLGRMGVRSIGIYVVVGGVAWLGFHESGVHATIAGVLLGLLTPAESWVATGTLRDGVARAHAFLHGDEAQDYDPTPADVAALQEVARESVSPLRRLEYALHPYSAFVIMPLFAFANAGVPIDPAGFLDPVAIAVGAGLLLGKPVGIVGFSYLAVKLGLARLPAGVGWGAITGGGFLAGIGFTMAIFIAGLALDGVDLDHAKLGVLAASAVAAVAGMSLLLSTLPKPGDDPGGG
jgi:NhaA family Na+:H+ antiporter